MEDSMNKRNLQVADFDQTVFRALAVRAAERQVTQKQVVTEALCKELGLKVPPMPERGRPKA